MAEKKQQNPKFTTIAAIAVWPKLDAPDMKFNAEKGGTYGVKLALDPNNEVHAKQLAVLDEQAQTAFEAMKKENTKWASKMVLADPYSPEVDKEGNETGRMLVNFTMPAVITRASDKKTWNMKPVLFDARGTPLPEGVKIGGGSLIKVRYETWPYFNASGKEKTAGATKRLVAVQVIELKTWQGGQDASAYGFEVEDGFDVTDGETSPAATPASNTPASDF